MTSREPTHLGRGVLPSGESSSPTFVPVTVCEALPLLAALRERRPGNAMPRTCMRAFEHARMFGKAAPSREQQLEVRAKLAPVFGHEPGREYRDEGNEDDNEDGRRGDCITAAIEAVMLANVGPLGTREAEALVPSLEDFSGRDEALRYDELDRVLAALAIANNRAGQAPPGVAGIDRRM